MDTNTKYTKYRKHLPTADLLLLQHTFWCSALICTGMSCVVLCNIEHSSDLQWRVLCWCVPYCTRVVIYSGMSYVKVQLLTAKCATTYNWLKILGLNQAWLDISRQYVGLTNQNRLGAASWTVFDILILENFDPWTKFSNHKWTGTNKRPDGFFFNSILNKFLFEFIDVLTEHFIELILWFWQMMV